jgi:hypothetical protein
VSEDEYIPTGHVYMLLCAFSFMCACGAGAYYHFIAASTTRHTIDAAVYVVLAGVGLGLILGIIIGGEIDTMIARKR